MRDEYRQDMDKVHAPAALVEKTRLLMREEAQKIQADKAQQAPQGPEPQAPVLAVANGGKKRTLRRVTSLAACLVVAAGVVGILLLNRGGDTIQTVLTPGQHVAEVQLQNGSLHFANSDNGPSIPFSVADSTRQEAGREAYLAYLGQPRLLEYEGFEEQSFTGYVWYSGMPLITGEINPESVTNDTGVFTYQNGAGEIVTLTLSAKGTLFDAQKANGEIDKKPVYTEYDGTNGVYLARFALSGISYQLAGESMEQETFVRLLATFFE